MTIKAIVSVIMTVYFIIVSDFALACGCGGGCGGGSGASPCSETSQACGGHLNTAVGTLAPTKAVNVGNTVCPVLGVKIASGSGMTPVTFEYKEKIYNLCCQGCVGKFKQDPEKFSKIADESI